MDFFSVTEGGFTLDRNGWHFTCKWSAEKEHHVFVVIAGTKKGMNDLDEQGYLDLDEFEISTNKELEDFLTIFLMEFADSYFVRENLRNIMTPLLRFTDLQRGQKVFVVKADDPTRPITGECVVAKFVKFITPPFLVEYSTGNVVWDCNLRPDDYRFIPTGN